MYYKSYNAFSRNVIEDLNSESSKLMLELSSLNKVSNLSNYEESYAWFLKRYYNFYTLPSNFRESSLTLRPKTFLEEKHLNSTSAGKLRLNRFLQKADSRTSISSFVTAGRSLGDVTSGSNALTTAFTVKMDKFNLFSFRTTDFLLSLSVFNANNSNQYYYFSPLRVSTNNSYNLTTPARLK